MGIASRLGVRCAAVASLAATCVAGASDAIADMPLSCSSGEARFEVLPAYGYNTYALGVSKDGKAVTGFGENGYSQLGTALLWNDVGALTALPRASGASTSDAFHGFEVSDPDPSSGARIVSGTSTTSRTYVRWVDGVLEDTGVTYLNGPGTAVTSGWRRYPIDATPDGRILVGEFYDMSDFTTHAFRLDLAAPSPTPVLLPTLGPPYARASAVSDDASRIAGQSYRITARCPETGCDPLAVQWIDASIDQLPGPTADSARSEVLDASEDGSVLVGWLSDGTPYQYAAIWIDGELTQIPMELPAEQFQREPGAMGVSPDGTVVVGTQNSVYGPAFIWDDEHGLRDLEVVLARDYGLEAEMDTWNLAGATGVTHDADGSAVVVGYMWPAARTVGPGQFRGFRVTLDIVSPCPDDDADGLCNEWEEQKYVDVDCDGQRDPTKDLELVDADPERMDIYVEVDSIQGTSIPAGVIVDVEQAFAKVPNSLIGNPTGKRGIALHLQEDDPFLTLPANFTEGAGCAVSPELDSLKATWFGNNLERGSPELLAAKRRLFRYAVVGGRFTDTSTIGRAAPFGPDFVVAPPSTYDRYDWSGVLMHELGHTLGLGHGGPREHVNYKPNYHSVMNYTWTIPGTLSIDGKLGLRRYIASWVLDYARAPFANHLDERNGLDESKGLGGRQGHGGHFVPVGPLTGLELHARVEREQGAIDFDRDGLPNEPVSDPVNVNEVNRAEPDPDPPDLEFLEATSDWGDIAIGYKSFFEHPNWTGPTTCAGFDASFLDEPTEEELAGLSVDMPIDCNGNGVPDDDELAAGTATDDDDDALLDECEPVVGDCDGDADVDLADRDLFVSAFGRSEGEEAYLECADLDGDRDVTFVDYQAWVAAYEAAQAAAAAPATAEGTSCGSTGAVEMGLLTAVWAWQRRRGRRGGRA